MRPFEYVRADDVAAALKEKGSKIVVEKGQIVKISKDKKGIITRERLTKEWTDWIDYWSVDFDLSSNRVGRNAPMAKASHQWFGITSSMTSTRAIRRISAPLGSRTSGSDRSASSSAVALTGS